MPDQPPPKPAPSPDESPGDENERPTINPPFDVEAFARAVSAPPPDHVATTRPPPAAKVSVPSASPTMDWDGRVTITNEVELEAARIQSATSTRPPGIRTTSALWMADALVPSVLPPRESGAPQRSVSGQAPARETRSLKDSAPAPEITERTIDDPAAEMRERASLGDYTGALEMAELILADDPEHVEAGQCVATCRNVLENMYLARLGPLDRAPMVIVPSAQMRWLSIDHRAGFILSLIDGASTVEMVIDVSGMPKLDALRILHELVQQRIVAFKG